MLDRPGHDLLAAGDPHRIERDRQCVGRPGTPHRGQCRLLDEPYYALPAPKTTGKELFHLGYLRDALAGFGTLTAEDVIATLTRLTARTVADAVRGVGATEVIASGGGTRNPTLMAMLDAELPGVPLRTSDELGLPSDAKEAYAFAVLGFLTLHALAGTAALRFGATRYEPPDAHLLGAVAAALLDDDSADVVTRID